EFTGKRGKITLRFDLLENGEKVGSGALISRRSRLISIDISAPELQFAEPDFEFTGKRGKITLRFDLLENGEKVGSGEKHMLVSGIRDYCQATVDDLISFYNQRKESLKPV
ncbi:MAG: DUF3581 family protein, partial [Pseudomonadota bacterium]